ncbi:MAG: ABC transporter permease [Eubacteriales bacterium]|jgi:ribose transport system permease protein|nr:ABC transporter permease [Eubacteriales bacterium]
MKGQLKSRIGTQKLIILATLAALFTFFSMMRPNFASYLNLMTIALSTCVNGILALGATFVITSGGIDLSLGTTMTFCSVMSGVSFVSWGFPIWLAIVFGFAVGAVCGGISGFAITKMKLPPFIATMAMQMMTKGLSLVVSGIKPVYFTGSENYKKIAMGNFLGIEGFYNAFILFIIIIVLAHLTYSKTLLGRYTTAIGSNQEAARLSGIKTDKWKILIYAVSGIFSAAAGLIMSSRLGSAQPQLGAGYELEAIAAAVIGGTSMSGGEGTIIGTVIGAFIISVLTNGLRTMAVSTEWQTVVTGFVLALAVYFDKLRRERRERA